MNPSRAHFNQTYIEVTYLGSGDNGDTYAAVSRQDADQILARHSHITTEACIDELRSTIVAIKTPKEDAIEGDLKNEINFLTNKLTAKHSCYTPRIDSYINADVQWLAIPFVSGGSLESFSNDFPHALTLSFRWHLALQLARAMLFMTSGITDMQSNTPLRKWRRNTHGDYFVGNILLRPHHVSSFLGFPDAVVVDFGRARKYPTAKPGGAEHNENFVHRFLNDIWQITETIRDTTDCYLSSDQPCRCRSCIEGEDALESNLKRLTAIKFSGDAVARARVALQQFSIIARIERNQRHHGMPFDAMSALAIPRISDAQLEAAVATLT